MGMSAAKKWVGVGVLAAVCFATGGLGLAVASKNDCMRDTSHQLVVNRVEGFTFDGRTVGFESIPVRSQVTWPFVVDVYYDVPRGMHEAMGHDRYLAMPWGTRRLSHEVIHTL